MDAGVAAAGGLPADLRVGAVRAAEAEGQALSSDAELYEDGRMVATYLLRSDFEELGVGEEYAEGVIDELRAMQGVELAMTVREPPVPDGPGAADLDALGHATTSTSPRSPGSAAAAATGARPASRPTSRSRRSSSSSAASSPMPPRALKPSGLILVDKPAGPSSFQVIAAIRRRTRRAHRSRRDARPVRDRAAARALRRGDAARALARRPRQALPHRRRPLVPHLDGRPGGRGGRGDGRTRPRRSSRSASTACAARSTCRCPPRRQ